MRIFEQALITKLRSIAALVTATNFSSSNLSIAMANPHQGVIKPGLFVEAETIPLPTTDNSRLKQSEVTLYAIGEERGNCKQIVDVIEAEFHDGTTKLEKKLDITNDKVYCIGSYWGTAGNPSWNEDLDCFEAPIVVTFKWSDK